MSRRRAKPYVPPRYVRWLRGINDSGNSLVSDTAAEVAATLLNVSAMQKGTSGDFSEMDHWIDAQMDKVIAVCDGNERLALFQAMSGLGFAMEALVQRIAEEDT